MTNEEIYKEETSFLSIKGPAMLRDAAFRAMDEAQKDEAERYGKFLLNYSPITVKEGVLKWWDKVMGGKSYTTEHLYELFKRQEK